MGRKQRNLSEYRAMWLFAMFDLPVDTPKSRKDYTNFRKSLIRQGFNMMQFSVYARYCGSEEKSEIIRTRIRQSLPPDGEVRILSVTERQFGKMEVFYGKKRAPTEKPPDQLLLF
jgi:CRISPR-associated protein Cas2